MLLTQSSMCNVLKSVYSDALLNIKISKSGSQKFGCNSELNLRCYILEKSGDEAQNVSQMHAYFIGFCGSACGRDKSILEEVQRKYPDNQGDKNPSALC